MEGLNCDELATRIRENPSHTLCIEQALSVHQPRASLFSRLLDALECEEHGDRQACLRLLAVVGENVGVRPSDLERYLHIVRADSRRDGFGHPGALINHLFTLCSLLRRPPNGKRCASTVPRPFQLFAFDRPGSRISLARPIPASLLKKGIFLVLLLRWNGAEPHASLLRFKNPRGLGIDIQLAGSRLIVKVGSWVPAAHCYHM